MRLPGESRDPEDCSAIACRRSHWAPAFAGVTLLLGMLVTAGPSFADASTKTKPAVTDEIDPALCQHLTKHTPSANVEYRPGMDVNGNAVAPADLAGGSQMEMPKSIDIPLTLQLSKMLNLDYTQYPFNTVANNANAALGVLTLEGDKVYFNGKPLSDTQQDNLAVLCMKRTSPPKN